MPLLTDAIVDPPGGPSPVDRGASTPAERLLLLLPAVDAPAVGALPMLSSGFPTFGSLHKLPKLNSGVLDLWAALLRAVPAARLLLFRDTLKGRRRKILSYLAARGMIPSRVEIRHDWTADEHWAIYSSIDVSLDILALVRPHDGLRIAVDGRAGCHARRRSTLVANDGKRPDDEGFDRADHRDTRSST